MIDILAKLIAIAILMIPLIIALPAIKMILTIVIAIFSIIINFFFPAQPHRFTKEELKQLNKYDRSQKQIDDMKQIIRNAGGNPDIPDLMQ